MVYRPAYEAMLGLCRYGIRRAHSGMLHHERRIPDVSLLVADIGSQRCDNDSARRVSVHADRDEGDTAERW